MAIPSTSILKIRDLYHWWMHTSNHVSIHEGGACETRGEFEMIREQLSPLASWTGDVIGAACDADAKLWPDRLIHAAVLAVDLDVAARELAEELHDLCSDEDDVPPATKRRAEILFELGHMDQQLAAVANRTLILLRKFAILTAGY